MTKAGTTSTIQHPDQQLFDLSAEWRRLDQAALDACGHEERCDHSFEQKRPPRPEALRCRSADRALFDLPAGQELPQFYSARDVEKLRAEPRRRRVLRFFDNASGQMIAQEDIARRDPATVTEFYCRLVCPVAQARADEIVAVWNRYEDTCRAAKTTAGVYDAAAAYERAAAALNATVEKISAYRAKTLDGLRARAKIVAEWRSGNLDSCDGGLASDEAALALANLRDLAAVRAA
jgi:hypothetical protein